MGFWRTVLDFKNIWGTKKLWLWSRRHGLQSRSNLSKTLKLFVWTLLWFITVWIRLSWLLMRSMKLLYLLFFLFAHSLTYLHIDVYWWPRWPLTRFWRWKCYSWSYSWGWHNIIASKMLSMYNRHTYYSTRSLIKHLRFRYPWHVSHTTRPSPLHFAHLYRTNRLQ